MTEYITLSDNTKIPLDDWYSFSARVQANHIRGANKRQKLWVAFQAYRKKHPSMSLTQIIQQMPIKHGYIHSFRKNNPEYDWASLDAITHTNSSAQIYKGKTIKQWAIELDVLPDVVYKALKRKGNLKDVGKQKDKLIIHKGLTPNQWAKKLQVSPFVIYSHLSRKGHLRDVGKTIKPNEKHQYRGKSLHYWADKLDVGYETIRYHIRKHGHLDRIGVYARKNKEEAN